MTNVRRLPTPLTEIWEWQLRATCRDLDSELFFDPERRPGLRRAEHEARAKRICGACPVIAQCRSHALRVDEPYGVWGGMSVTERRDLLAGRAYPPA